MRSSSTVNRRSVQDCTRIGMIMIDDLCIISKTKIIGSDLLHSDRSRWVVAWGMVNDLPIFKDLWTGSKYRSKDFTAFPLPAGMTCYEFLGIPLPKGTVAKFNHPGDAADQPHQIITLNDASIDRDEHTIKQPAKPAPSRPYETSGEQPAHTLVDARAIHVFVNGVLLRHST
eukprot:COSAG02_NODE_985_length_15457_cov_108.738247_4_plen_172_part_00